MTDLYQNTSKAHSIIIKGLGGGGVIPDQITLVAPLSYMADMDQV